MRRVYPFLYVQHAHQLDHQSTGRRRQVRCVRCARRGNTAGWRLSPARLVDARSLAGQTVAVAGWVKTGRENGNNTFAFLEINDGSSFANMQVLLPKEVHELKPLCQTGTSVAVTGVLVALEGPSRAKPASRSLRRVLLTPQVNPGSLYRCGKRR